MINGALQDFEFSVNTIAKPKAEGGPPLVGESEPWQALDRPTLKFDSGLAS